MIVPSYFKFFLIAVLFGFLLTSVLYYIGFFKRRYAVYKWKKQIEYRRKLFEEANKEKEKYNES